VGFKATPHMLCHTFGTQLINAGCKITTIQALLGHKRLNTTLTYARVHDQTVAEDYYAAMAVIKERMSFHLAAGMNSNDPKNSTPADLLVLMAALQTKPLTESQQAVVDELQCGLLTLAESLNGKPYGHYGVAAMEAAAAGKIVVTQNLNQHVYTDTYGECPFFICNTESKFLETIEYLLSLNPLEISVLQTKTYNWICQNHSYKKTGEYILKQIL